MTIDKNGQEIGTAFTYINTNGEVGSALLARNPTNPAENTTLNVFYTADGIVHTYCVTPQSNSNDHNIANTSWVRQNATPTGSLLIWCTDTPPAGYLLCDGSAISRTTYAKLFGVIGTTWGDGDGSTTFNLPNAINCSLWQNGYISAGGRNPGALPKITGSVYNLLFNHTEGDGALYWSDTATVNWNVSTGSGGEKAGRLNFDASKSHTAYNRTDTLVIPSSINVLFCIKYI